MLIENAIGAISRSKQLIVVGDQEQLPPTTFFTKMIDDSEYDEDFEEPDESILQIANVTFAPIRQLNWHYRSMYASLINFSNSKNYGGGLHICPNVNEISANNVVKTVKVEGTFNNRLNVEEARILIKEAIEHMKTKKELSLGICTMNLSQKDYLIDEFKKQINLNPEIQEYLDYWENNEDGLQEFFIKNLEAIQGDERDVIFISTLYGPQSLGGPVHQRFGPINSKNGYRRLNVLFSRAKQQITTFTSLNPNDIKTGDNKSKGVNHLHEWLVYSNTGNILTDEIIKESPRITESPFEDFVAEQIRAYNCEVDPQVGVEKFRIDLGVKHPEWTNGYLLGVECDGATYHSSKSSRDRDRLRQEILEKRGWTIHRIWSTDWFQNQKKEIEKLHKAIDDALLKAKKKQVRH